MSSSSKLSSSTWMTYIVFSSSSDLGCIIETKAELSIMIVMKIVYSVNVDIFVPDLVSKSSQLKVKQ